MQLRYVTVLLRWAGRDRRAVGAQPEAHREERAIRTRASRYSAVGPTSLDEFYDVHAARAYGLALRILCGDRATAEDVVAEAFIAVWPRRPVAGDGETAHLQLVLLWHVRELCIDVLRERQPVVRRPGVGERSSCRTQLPTRDGDAPTSKAMREHVAALSLDQREAIERALYEGQRSEQIAEDMGTSKASVHGAMRRGLRTLAEGLSSARTPATPPLSSEVRKRSAR